jgi:alkaline phosphatase
MPKIAIHFLLVLLFGACSASEPLISASTTLPSRQARNVILLIGDGMGLSQISAALYSNNNQLAMASFPVIGFQKTHSGDNLITDSAAAATALACGIKTYNGAIGMNMDTLPCNSIMMDLKGRGWSTGLIATSSIVHATPAAFFGHQDSRNSYEAIATDIIDKDIDLLIGGGSAYFKDRKTDKFNLYEALRQRGYFVSDHSMGDLLRSPFNPALKFAYFTAETQPGSWSENRTYLPMATKFGIDFLLKRSKENGFFIMIEGSQIDWKCHQNEGREVVKEVLDFDAAVSQALAFAKGRNDTLVLVTADHETGGMAINPGSKMGKPKIVFTTNSHTAAMTPVFAYGPGADLFSGIYDNTEITAKIRKAIAIQHHTQNNEPLTH